MRKSVAAVLGVILCSNICQAAEGSVLVAEQDRISYSLGFQIGGDFKRENENIDLKAFRQGLADSLAQKAPAISRAEMQAILLEMKKKIVAGQRTEMLAMREQRVDEGKSFLAANAKKNGVVTLPSGLQYKVIKKGTGKQPGPTDRVKVHYKGTLIDGTQFGGRRQEKEPQTFYVNGVIPGLTEGLQLMREGAHWEFYVPADLAYGRRGPLADRTVIFDLDLVSVETTEGTTER